MKQDVKQRNQCISQWRKFWFHPFHLFTVCAVNRRTPRYRSLESLTCSAPTEDQVARAKALAEDLLVVLRIEYAKARGDSGGGGYGGGYQQQAYGQDQGQYAGYYQVCPFISPTSFILDSFLSCSKDLSEPIAPWTALTCSNNLKLHLLPLPHLELHQPRAPTLGLNTPHTGLHTVTTSMILSVSSS